MSHRDLASLSGVAVVVFVVLLGAAPAVAQTDVPRTAWGQPDLQGVWDFRSITPLQRPEALADKEFLGAYTWAAWFFRQFVRETADFTVEEAVRKLAAAPADRLGLTDRGRIENGAWADVVVFDPARFRERGTLEAPNRLATGVAHVVVNGVVSMEGGAFTGDRGGRVLRRS